MSKSSIVYYNFFFYCPTKCPTNNKKSSSKMLEPLISMVRLGRFERSTHGLEGRCSIQLSYRRIFNLDGRSSRIRTCDPLVPSQVLYQTEPCPVDYKIYYTYLKVVCQLFFLVFLLICNKILF